MKKSIFYPLLLAGALSLGSVTLYPVPTQAQAVQTMGQGQVDWPNGVIKVTGSGAAPSRAGMSQGQKRLMAKRAAQADAYRQLTEIIYGVNVDAETVVSNFVTESDIVKTKVSGLIKGAKMGDIRYMSDGTVELDMTMGIYGQNSLSSVMMPEVIQKKQIQTQPSYPTATPTPNVAMPTPMPTARPTPPTQNHQTMSGSYSGVIIDCRGLGVEPAMSPQIKDSSGKEIYIGDRPIDPDLVVNIGIVGYAKSMDAAKSNARIGLSPLILKASNAGGRLHKTDAIISPQDAQKLMQADAQAGFLGQSKVIFVVD